MARVLINSKPQQHEDYNIYLIVPGSHSTAGSMVSPETASWAFEILNAASVIAIERNSEASARCWPGHILGGMIT